MTRVPLILLAAFAAGPALAQSKPAAPTEAVESLVRCQSVSEPSARLACFDQAAARLVQAEKSGDVVIVDRAAIRQARQSSFGFDFDGFKLFSRGERPEEPMTAVTLVAQSARQGEDGRWVLVTTDGQVWRQTDRESLGRRPKAGSKLEIRSAAMGSYFLNVDGQRALRVRREK